MKAAEDFLLLLLHADIVVAAEKLSDYDFGSESVGEVVKSIIILTSCFHHLQV